MANLNNPTGLPASLVSALTATLRDIAHQMSRMTEAADHSNRLTDHATRAFEWLATNIAENTATVRALHEHLIATSCHPGFPPQAPPQHSQNSSIIMVEHSTLQPDSLDLPPPVAVTPPPSSSVSYPQTSVPASSVSLPPQFSTTSAPPSPQQEIVTPKLEPTLSPPLLGNSPNYEQLSTNLVSQALQVTLRHYSPPPPSWSPNNNDVLPHELSPVLTASAIASQALATGVQLPDNLPSNHLHHCDLPLQKRHTSIAQPLRMVTRSSLLNMEHAHSMSSHSTQTHYRHHHHSDHSSSSTEIVDLTAEESPAKRPALSRDLPSTSAPRKVRLSWSNRYFYLGELNRELRAEKSRIRKRSWAKGDSDRYNAEILRVHREVMTIKDPVHGPHDTLPRSHTPPRRLSRAVGVAPGTLSQPLKSRCLSRPMPATPTKPTLFR